MCEKNIMKRSELQKFLFEGNRMYVRFHSEDFKNIDGYQDLMRDIVAGDLKPKSQYSKQIQEWLDYHEINLNEIEDD